MVPCLEHYVLLFLGVELEDVLLGEKDGVHPGGASLVHPFDVIEVFKAFRYQLLHRLEVVLHHFVVVATSTTPKSITSILNRQIKSQFLTVSF